MLRLLICNWCFERFLPILVIFVSEVLGNSIRQEENAQHFPREQKLPKYILEHGKIGLNYDLDQNGMPYIWCEKYENITCQKPSARDCTTRVKCYADQGRSQLLGCMAVLVYNTTLNETEGATNNSRKYIDREHDLKGCWSQGASELRECVSNDTCVMDTRRTGTKERAAKFCCCRTHESPPIVGIEEEDSIWVQVAHVGILIVLALAIIIGLCILSFYFHKQMNTTKKQLASNPEPNHLSPLIPEMPVLEHITLQNEVEVIINDIELSETPISDGGFAKVYHGTHRNVSMAVKIYPSSSADTWVNEQEIYLLGTVGSNKNIARFLGAFRKDENFYWLLTVYYPGGSLLDYLTKNKPDVPTSVKIISTMLNGLAFLHEENTTGPNKKPTIVHRDIKSKNILMKDDLTTCIVDFGLALRCDKLMAEKQNHSQVGTRRYMSPEVLEGATEFSNFAFQQIDVYAAALVIWEVISRTSVHHTNDDDIDKYLMPYEEELGIGITPTLGQLRQKVVVEKMRPQIRSSLKQNSKVEKIVKTMVEMWDAEPDGRITSGCARDRITALMKASEESRTCPKVSGPEQTLP